MEFESIYRKLLACKEIVYKNNYGNCVTNDTGVLTVSSGHRHKQTSEKCTIETTFVKGKSFEIEFDYLGAIGEEIEKFDEHLNAFIASKIEQNLLNIMKKHHKKYCQQCNEVFAENTKVFDAFINLKNESITFHTPCQSTVDIIKAANKILSIIEGIEGQEIYGTNIFESTLKTIMCHLHYNSLYTETNFDSHHLNNRYSITYTHQDEFIYYIINEYMKLKSENIGSRISEEEQGTYIRHNYKKRVHEAGQ